MENVGHAVLNLLLILSTFSEIIIIEINLQMEIYLQSL